MSPGEHDRYERALTQWRRDRESARRNFQRMGKSDRDIRAWLDKHLPMPQARTEGPGT